MLADLRVLDTGAELWLDTERVGAAGAVRHAAPRRASAGTRAAQAHARAGAALARRARRRAGRGRRPRPPSTPTPRASSAARRCCSSRTDLGVDVVCAAEDADARARRPATAPAVPEAAAEVLRVESGRPRYGVDLDDATIPQEAGPQRARRELHEGLLRRPGDRRAPALQGQAQPPPARAAAVGPGRRPARRSCSASARSGGWARACVSPRLGPIALALVRREAERATRLGRRRRRDRRGRRAAVRVVVRARPPATRRLRPHRGKESRRLRRSWRRSARSRDACSGLSAYGRRRRQRRGACRPARASRGRRGLLPSIVLSVKHSAPLQSWTAARPA